MVQTPSMPYSPASVDTYVKPVASAFTIQLGVWLLLSTVRARARIIGWFWGRARLAPLASILFFSSLCMNFVHEGFAIVSRCMNLVHECREARTTRLDSFFYTIP